MFLVPCLVTPGLQQKDENLSDRNKWEGLGRFHVRFQIVGNSDNKQPIAAPSSDVIP